MSKLPVVVLLSGGMDSVVTLYYAAKMYDIRAALSFHYGAKHHEREIPMAMYHSNVLDLHHEIRSLDVISSLFSSALLVSGEDIPDGHYEEEVMKKTVVPFRNGIFLSIAAGYAESIEAKGVVIAAHAGDHAIYPDCRSDFMDVMGEAIRLGTYAGIEIIRPWVHNTKADLVRAGTELGINFAKTWSCYKGLENHCGTCGTCVERREAFQLAGILDPTVYLKSSSSAV